MPETFILVTGGRDYDDADEVKARLEGRDDPVGDITLVVGDASGADALARWHAPSHWTQMRFQADWAKHGRAAGPIRNQEMVDFVAKKVSKGHHGLVEAFPGGRGTKDCARRALKAGLPVFYKAGS